LYAPGQSVRGPSFCLSFDLLVDAGCRPLLERFLVLDGTPVKTIHETGYFERIGSKTRYELYIPAPASTQRGQAMLYHVATRNFFAWVCGKALVGARLSTALIGLLNSMNEFRSEGAENEADILDYMDEAGYSDMRNSPDHALAILQFAENFHFRTVWIDAFAHCVGMSDKLQCSSELEVNICNVPLSTININVWTVCQSRIKSRYESISS
jgi:hypothetical protein